MRRFARLTLLCGLAGAGGALSRAANPPPPAAAPAAAPAARTLTFSGPATNTTAEATATMRLVLTIAGEKASATLQTARPLAGSGQLTGLYRGGWCELAGRLDEGMVLRLCGVFDGKDFRGMYTAASPGQPVQYGRVRLAPGS